MAIPPSPLSGLKTAWFGPDGREVDATPAVIGPRGPQGIQGVQGETGETGLSAYELALANGFVGTEEQWLASLAAESAAAEAAAGAAQNSALAAQGFAETAQGAAATAATDAAATAAVAAAEGVVDELAAHITQSEAARDQALNGAAAVKQTPGIFYWRDETITAGLRYADLATTYDLPATKLTGRVLNGGGACDVSVWVDGVRVVEPVTVGGTLVEQAIDITIRAGSDVQFGVDNVTGSVLGLYARVEGLPEGFNPSPSGDVPEFSAFGESLVAAEDAEAARDLLDIAAVPNPIAAWGRIASDFTLANSTASQRLFNCSASGAVTLEAGHYLFDFYLLIEDMSTSTGHGVVNLLGAGTATVAGDLSQMIGFDNSTPLSPAAQSGCVTQGVAPWTTNMVSAGTTGTALAVRMSGRIRVTAAGTLIPSFALAHAAAATVKAGTSITFIRLPGELADAAYGSWS